MLGSGSIAVAAVLAVWLWSLAGPEAEAPVSALGAIAVAGLLVALAAGRGTAIGGVVTLLAAAYAVVLVVDDPPLDTRSALVGTALLVVAELAHLSVESRLAVAAGGGVARRVAGIAALALGALGLGGLLLVSGDVVRSGGITIEVLGAVAAVLAIGLLVAAARSARD